MSSSLRVNTIVPSTGTNVAIGTANGTVTFTDSVNFVLGTGSSIFSPASNTLTFGTNDAERLRITSAGNLGIGDASPTKPLTVGTTTPVILLDDQSSRTLEIRGPSTTHNATVLTTSTHDLLLGTNNAERLRITSAGLVGINSTSPATVLDIQSTKNTDGLTITKAGTQSVFLGHNGSGNEGILVLKENGTTNVQIYAETNQNSYINSGNFGIGTNSPSYKLDVRPTAEDPTTGSPAAGAFSQIRADDATVGKGPSLSLMNLSGSKETGWRLSALTASGNNGDFTIHGYGGGATYSEYVRITAAGKTGIGGLTPLNLLNVNATGSMGLYGTVSGKAGHSIKFIRKYGSSATHNFAVINGASPHGQSRLGGFVATYTFRSAYGFDSDGGGHGVRMLSGRVRDSGEWGFDTETNYGTGDSPRPTLQGVDNNDGTCTLQVVNPGSTHSYGEFHIVAWDCQITTPTT